MVPGVCLAATTGANFLAGASVMYTQPNGTKVQIGNVACAPSFVTPTTTPTASPSPVFVLGNAYTIAGHADGSLGSVFNDGGPANLAFLNGPMGIAFDAIGNYVIADFVRSARVDQA